MVVLWDEEWEKLSEFYKADDIIFGSYNESGSLITEPSV